VTRKKSTNSNSQLYEIADWIVLHRRPNGFYSGRTDFRDRILYLGWVGLEPTTNALKGRCSTIELPTRIGKRALKLLPNLGAATENLDDAPRGHATLGMALPPHPFSIIA
jgi:hypothetical protein